MESWNHEIRDSRNQGSRNSGIHRIMESWNHEIRDSKNQEMRNSGIHRIVESWNQGSRNRDQGKDVYQAFFH